MHEMMKNNNAKIPKIIKKKIVIKQLTPKQNIFVNLKKKLDEKGCKK